MDNNVIDILYGEIKGIKKDTGEIKTSIAVLETKYVNLHDRVCGNGEPGIADDVKSHEAEINKAKGAIWFVGIYTTIVTGLAITIAWLKH